MERYVVAGDIVCNVTDMETIYNRERKKIFDKLRRHDIKSKEAWSMLRELDERWKVFKRRNK